jgi:Arc/MetJ-type ribon-helix-helix transcriptional regulator
MNLKLTPAQEQIIQEELKTGQFRTPEEVIGRALQVLQDHERLVSRYGTLDKPSMRQDEAVTEMLAFVEKNHVRLDGITVKDLIHEGHRL